MSTPDPLATLNPSIVGQAEKAHNAVLDRVLVGTSLDERQWITLQLAMAAGSATPVADLVTRVSAAAKFSPAVVETAIAALTESGLVERAPNHELTVTGAGTSLVGELRSKAADHIARAYGQIPAEDLATAARVLTAITATLSEDLARLDAG